MILKAKKDKIILRDLNTFETAEGGFDVKNAIFHRFGVIHDVPNSLSEEFSVGEVVVLREKAIPEKLTVEGVDYHFAQAIDILCKIDKNE